MKEFKISSDGMSIYVRNSEDEDWRYVTYACDSLYEIASSIITACGCFADIVDEDEEEQED